MLIAPAHADYSQGADPAYPIATDRATQTVYAPAPHATWVLLTTPDSRPVTPQGLFGTEMQGYEYGSEWVVYTFDGRHYRIVPRYSTIPSGQGFWFMQVSGKSISVSHPGVPLSGSARTFIRPGWNIGGAPNTTLTVGSHNFLMYAHNAGTGEYEKQDDGTLFKPFRGYWIYNPGAALFLAFRSF